jgi:hypothetical protein
MTIIIFRLEPIQYLWFSYRGMANCKSEAYGKKNHHIKKIFIF